MQSLKESPLFNLSLSTKELFHSNFLYWIGCTYYEKFIEILEQLGFTFKDSKEKKAVIKREYRNFDLCLIFEDKPMPICVIENKVKSIPRLDQIKQYDSQIKKYNGTTSSCGKFLLTLVNEFPNKDKITKLGWKIITYNDLYDALDMLSNNIDNDYHKHLIKDYSSFIKNLNELSQNWVQQNTMLPYHAGPKEKELRIGDLQEKLLYSKLSIEIGEKCTKTFGYPVKYGEKTQKIIEEFKEKKEPKIYIDFNYTHQQGLLDIKFPINNEYVVGIQIQGTQYRHFIEWNESNGQQSDERWKSVSNEKLTKNFFDVTGKTGNFNKENKKEYNQFGNSFLYQYRTIKETTKDIIIKDIISDLNIIICNTK